MVEIQEGEQWRSLDLEENHEEDSTVHPTTLRDLCLEKEEMRKGTCEERRRHEAGLGSPSPGTCSSAVRGEGGRRWSKTR